MNKLKIVNPKLLSLILGSAIVLSQTGCNQAEEMVIAKTEQAKSQDLSKINALEVFKNPFFTHVGKINFSTNFNTLKLNKINPKLKKINVVVTNPNTVVLKKKANEDSKSLVKISPFQKLVKLTNNLDGWAYVKYQDKRGYIKADDIKKIGNTYIDVDISKQRLTYYKDGKKFLSTDVVTGKDTTPTVTGLFPIYEKRTDYNMIGEDYVSHADYVLKFYKGYYIHDASWRSVYGGNIYHASGSHGCVNTPYKKVKKLYNNTLVNTKVFVHK